MGMLVKIILLLVFGILVAFLRLLFEDSDAVEIELRQVERWDSESPLLKQD